MSLYAIRPFVEAARRRFAAKAVILMYHRVADLAAGDVDPWALCVSPKTFAAQLSALKTHFEPISLRELGDAKRRGRVRAGSVVITFDDGYADTLHNAVPLLARNGLPATFFLTSAALGAAREFWWDELERLLLRPARLPDRLRITWGDATRSWELDDAAQPYSAPGRREPATPPSEAPPGTRLGFYYSVWHFLRTLDDTGRGAVLEQLGRWLDEDRYPRASHRVLSREEARLLARAPGAEIGAHSVTHPALSLLEPEDQRQEIERSKHALEALISQPVWSFAYPYGDYGDDTPGLVRDAGFALACTAEPGVVWRRAMTFLLPRLAVEDWEADHLVGRIRELLQ